ncbi:excisionase family DNA-binding protein [Myceligenerans pegani]|uniref:Excisionase family DNA-binding protein n=1 Tax=Myceligenerans pegani TaxID=2776917 RepID=A0ABR9MZK2_9MICO|nr:excisionase family DNA-binding protein [Myceligenerans sp. TRM 65318]MBE1876823.1 excisionase family DNA-binding protein [Myceligenerans sp. TRM 65318]MBE3019094.1 excisionase family DNA-binding protein [Myceligenerans sp. TRM 65318]
MSDFTQHQTSDTTSAAGGPAPHGENLTAAEAARRLGVSSLHVIDLLEAGELDFHMDGSDILFDAADVDTYKADRESRDQESLVGA